MRELCPWHALTVKHQHEKAVQFSLEYQGFATLVPTYRAHRTWSDRVKELEIPLFSGYVFGRFPRADWARVIDTPGVTGVVAFGGVPAEISGSEIAALEAVMASKLHARPWPHLKAGDRVQIQHGPLRGLEGTLIRERIGLNQVLQFVVGVELLQRSIAVELAPDTIQPVRAPVALAAV